MTYDVTRLRTAFRNLVGWRSPGNPDFPVLTTTVTTSNSGLYFQDQYPFLGIETLDAIAEDFDNFELSAWSGATTYAIDEKVLYSGRAYISLQGSNLNKNPSTQTAYWRTMLEDWLLKQNEQTAVMVIEQMVSRKKLLGSSRALMDHRNLFEGAASMSDTIIKESRFVGLKITPNKRIGLGIHIHLAGFQFSQNQSGLTLYLFHSSKQDAIATFSVTTTAGAKNFQWVSIDKLLYYANQDTTTITNQVDAGGCYFFGYFEDDVTGQALNKDYDWSKEPDCNNCNKDVYNKVTWKMYNKYFRVEPIEVDESNLNGTQLWDIEDTEYPRSGNYGINLNVSIICDLTDIFILEKKKFTQAVIKQMAVNILKLMIWSNRQNKIEEVNKKDAMLELKGISESNFYGLESELKREIECINIDFSDFDSPCFEQTPNKGIKRGAW